MSDRNAAQGARRTFTRDDYRRLAARIKEHRTTRGWKQSELSQRAGISADRLSRLERGVPIRVDELVGVSFAFGLGVDELLFAPLKDSSRELLDYLIRKILEIIPAEDVPALIRLLQALAAGLRARSETDAKGDPE